jgi:hypothetical protein
VPDAMEKREGQKKTTARKAPIQKMVAIGKNEEKL